MNNKWVKSQKVVNFPFKDFDPTSYLASVPQETILRHQDIHDTSVPPSPNICESNQQPKLICDDEIVAFDREQYNKRNDCGDSGDDGILEEEQEENVDDEDQIDGIHATIEDDASGVASKTKNPRHSHNSKRLPPLNTLERRKRLVSTSLARTPVIDGEFIDFHKHQLKDDENPFNLKYQLYAVVVSILFLFYAMKSGRSLIILFDDSCHLCVTNLACSCPMLA